MFSAIPLLVILGFSGVVVCSYDFGLKFVTDINTYGQNSSELIHSMQFELPSKTFSSFEIRGLDQAFLSRAVFQVHAFYLNVTLSLDRKLPLTSHQNGTNIGFVLRPGNYSQMLYLWNDNFDDVQCMFAIIVYNHSAPIVGGCSLDGENPALLLEDTKNYVIVQTPPARLSDEVEGVRRSRCGDPMKYFTHFLYLDQLNFHHEVYFDGIRSLMFSRSGFEAKQVYSPLRRYFEKVPGTGIIINSVVYGENGEPAFYIPTATYSCPANTWKTRCSDIHMLKRAFCVVLVLHSVVMILNLVMPELTESIMNGMLFGSFSMLFFLKNHHFMMSSFDIFITTIFGGFIVAAVFGYISLYVRIGRYLTKWTFSNLLMSLVMEIFFDTFASLYVQVGSALAMSVGFHFIRISFSVLLGGLLLIMSLSYLLKVGNLHRLLVNNFHVLTTVYTSTSSEDSLWNFMRHNYVNYKIRLNLLDCSLVAFYLIVAILLTIRKELYFRNNSNLLDADRFFSDFENIEEYDQYVARQRRDRCLISIQRSEHGQLRIVSRCRRRHHYRSNVINERSPLISHWLASDESEDDVFESPNSNLRFMRTLSSDSKEQIDAIQNFSN